MDMQDYRIRHTGLDRKREKRIEAALVGRVEELAGYAIKLSAVGRRGLPDRMIMLPNRILFVEVKALGEKPSKQQALWLERFRQMGFEAYVLDREEDIDEILA